jgi:hypothetical protein
VREAPREPPFEFSKTFQRDVLRGLFPPTNSLAIAAGASCFTVGGEAKEPDVFDRPRTATVRCSVRRHPSTNGTQGGRGQWAPKDLGTQGRVHPRAWAPGTIVRNRSGRGILHRMQPQTSSPACVRPRPPFRARNTLPPATFPTALRRGCI